MQQWVDEIKSHSPSLRVLVYDGWTKLPKHVQHSPKNSPYIADENLKLKQMTKGKQHTAVDNDHNDLKNTGRDESTSSLVDWATYANSFDVCITTYNVLQQDLNVARTPPKRPRRESAEYSKTARVRSPLVCVEFFRVIMDEVCLFMFRLDGQPTALQVQMVGGGRTLCVSVMLW